METESSIVASKGRDSALKNDFIFMKRYPFLRYQKKAASNLRSTPLRLSSAAPLWLLRAYLRIVFAAVPINDCLPRRCEGPSMRRCRCDNRWWWRLAFACGTKSTISAAKLHNTVPSTLRFTPAKANCFTRIARGDYPATPWSGRSDYGASRFYWLRVASLDHYLCSVFVYLAVHHNLFRGFVVNVDSAVGVCSI